MENYTVKLTEQEINTILMALSGNVAVYESTRVKYDVKDLFHPDFGIPLAFEQEKEDNFALQQKLAKVVLISLISGAAVALLGSAQNSDHIGR